MSKKNKTDPAARAVDAHVGQKIREYRRMAGITQKDLAGRLGVTFQQVQKYERGRNRLSAANLCIVAKILNRPMRDFFPDTAASIPPVSAPTDRKMLRTLGSFNAIKDPKVRNSLMIIIHALADISQAGDAA